jgi:lysophospholipid acyltransferase (LPLAT)-like uncharacterized protein
MLVQRLKLVLAPPLWRLLSRTVQIHAHGSPHDPQQAPAIYACLHRDMIPAILYVQPARPVLLVSRSRDGDILCRTLGSTGFSFVRGSTGSQGGRAFVQLLAALRAGRSVGVAVDGPRGPFGMVQEGAIQLSRHAGCPIVPLALRPRSCWRLPNWDRTVVPRPWSRVDVWEQEPMTVVAGGPDADPAIWCRRLAARLLEPAGPQIATVASELDPSARR